jgi:acetyl-CoA C-acetyltransferase
MVGFPYTKYMTAVINVDQSAALLMTSVAGARALQVPEDRWVYPLASAEGTDRWFVSDRPNYHSSPAMRVAGERALAAAEITIDNVTHLDLYSCFPSAVQITRDMLGMTEDDPRTLTVTGGLPYAGGPVNNYAMHSIATMIQRLRRDPGTVGLVTALGWYMTKYAVGVYAAGQPARPWRRAEYYDDAAHGTEPAPALSVEANGRGVIETCTVVHDREGKPARGIVVGRLDDGSRFIAVTPEDPTAVEALMGDHVVGQRGHVRTADGFNLFNPD